MAQRRSLRRAALAAVLAAVLGAPSATSVTAAPTSELVAEGLEFPIAFTFDPAGRIFYVERHTGEIRIYDPAVHGNDYYFTIPGISPDVPTGLYGIAVHPEFPERPLVYVAAHRHENLQIIRVRGDGTVGTSFAVLHEFPGPWRDHLGAKLTFDASGKLLVSTGDGLDPGAATLVDGVRGRVLRMSARGTAPKDNPTPGSLTFAYGFRNPFGMGIDPMTGVLWVSDNGPDCNDELDRVRGNRNYGWGPTATCTSPPDAPFNTNQDGVDPKLPKWWLADSVGTTGMAFGGDGALYAGTFNDRTLRRFELDAERRSIVSEQAFYVHPRYILAVERGPDGAIYFSDGESLHRLTP